MISKKQNLAIQRMEKRASRREKQRENPLILSMPGIQRYIAEYTGIDQAIVCRIMRNERRASPEQAAALEFCFIRLGLPITRWDILYGPKPDEKLDDYIIKRVKSFRRGCCKR